MTVNIDYEQKLVESYRRKGYEITEQDLKEVRKYCDKKIKQIGISNRQFYMPFLFMDEMKNHVCRKLINQFSQELIRISQDQVKLANNMQKKMEVFQDV